MAGLVKNILKTLFVAVFVPGIAFGTQAPNVRTVPVKSTVRAGSDANTSVRRSATSVIARTANLNNRQARTTIVKARPVVSRIATNVSARAGTRSVVSKSNLSRAATTSRAGKVRSASNKSIKTAGKGGTLSRAGTARATAVFNDITKIGGGYATCRDAYATCMDQFCANANDAYRRCFCSDRFADFRDQSDNLDQALGMLADFQNNNLNAVDKTTAEVDAMYSSTAGEEAIKKDTSSTQKLLDNVDDILSGKTSDKKTIKGLIDFGDFTNLDDIWSNNASNVFNTRNVEDFSKLEGNGLYKRAANQCVDVTKSSCATDTMFNLAQSAYSVMITQDCNIFEKSLNAKKEAVTQTVRKAENLLREARLEYYREHNNQDFNACMDKVDEAMRNPNACGADYEKCLDFTGRYINAQTGEPIYSALFQMTERIAPDLGESLDFDVVSANESWNEFLESMKHHVDTALDTCRDLSEDVWDEYKRTALIRIAQGQDAVIQQAKDSCVETIAECYDTQNGTLKELAQDIKDKKYDVSAGRALTVRGVCYDQVMACAALYGNSSDCAYDKTTRKITNNGKCGLQELLKYVDTVDTARVAKGCETVVSEKAHELCDPNSTSKAKYSETYDTSLLDYPAGCADMPAATLRNALMMHAKEYCALDDLEGYGIHTDVVNSVIRDIFDKLGLLWTQGCEEDFDGMWVDDVDIKYINNGNGIPKELLNTAFYKQYYGGDTESVLKAISSERETGVCLTQSVEAICKVVGGTLNGNDCDLSKISPDWYKKQCNELGGTYNSNKCTIP